METRLDSKGRVVIPEDARRRAGLRAGSKVKVSGEKERIIITKSLRPIDFIKALEGALKKGSRAECVDPLKLKEIWLAD